VKKEKILITGLIFTGLFLMYQTAGTKPGTVEIEDIDQDMVGDKVTVSGEVQNLSTRAGTQFFKIQNGGENITAVTFRENLLLYEGLQLEASGKVTIHRGETEFVLNQMIEKS